MRAVGERDREGAVERRDGRVVPPRHASAPPTSARENRRCLPSRQKRNIHGVRFVIPRARERRPRPRRNPNSNAARSFRRGVCGRGSGWDWDGGSGAGAAWSTKAKRSPMKGTDSEGFYGGGGGCGGACPTSKEEEGREEERWNA